MTCSRSWELRAIDEGRLAAADIAAFERHARTCASCHAELAARNDLAHLVSQIEAPVPTDLDLRRLRGKVLRDAMSASPSRAPRFAIGAIAAMAAALLLVKVTMRTKALTPEPFAAVVMPVPSAAWTQTREQRLERVTLTSGDVELRVRKQDAGERFLVVVPDGEVEVRGTTFEVSVHDGQTTRVHVDDGVVIVRVHGDTTLHAGESWPAPPQSLADVTPVPSAVLPIPTPTATVTAAHVSSSQKPPVATPHDHPTLSPSAAPSNDQEMADYERAISVYRLRHFEQAADLLHEFALAHPASSFLDDASFMEASSLASAGRSDAAALLAERLLQRFPQSFHRKEAAILVARQRRDRGDCGGAREVLSAWRDDAETDSDVMSALGTCRESAPSH